MENSDNMNNKTKLTYLLFPIIIALFLIVGIYLGALLTSVSINDKTIIFSKNKRFNTASKLNEILNFIGETYVDSVDKRDLTEKSISSMLSLLDPHSSYIPAREFDSMNEPLEGNFDGIGIEFRLKNDTLMVIAPVAKGPSEKVGIKAGDRIIQVDTIPIAGVNITNEKVIKLLKGPKGTKVNAIIKRSGVKKLLLFTITRGRIPIYSIDSPYMINENTGYLKITRFSKTTYVEFLKATDQLQKEGMKNLIIDLRGNGGGLLSAATSIADEILPKNKMIVYTQGRVRRKEEYFSSNKGTLQQTNIAILINENSASASEILAGAIQDNDKGIILGRRSFGKGLVQEQVIWPDGSALRLTVARYYTPTGRCIQKPYGEDAEGYRAEAYDRYSKGELLSPDSIHFPDSLKFYTSEGKVVYGGGGIMPDIFVPLDTNGGSNYLYELRYRGIMQDFALTYIDKKRKQFLKQYKDAIDFKNKFQISNDLFNSIIKYADENEVKRNLAEIRISKEIISRDVKAAICRNLFSDFGYYVIMNDYDTTVQQAIKALNNHEKRH